MKYQKKIVVCIISVMFFLFFNTSNASANNEMVEFSRKSGFYSEPFYLEMRCAEGDIYYTLDSTEPDENSFHYTSPIYIYDISSESNNYSDITDVCIELTEDNNLLQNRWGYQRPSNPVDKAMVVRACCISNGKRSTITNAVYFIEYDKKTYYDITNIISIISDPKGLFDPYDGIYVLGDVFQHVSKQTIRETANYGGLNANYAMRGKDWERKAWINMFDEKREEILSGPFGIRIQGGTSRGLLPKSLNIFARKEYGNRSSFLPEIKTQYGWEPSSINLYSGAHCMTTKLNDYLANMLTLDLSIFSRRFIPYVLFLDGEYWGSYWLIPRYEYEYFKTNFNIMYNDIIMIKPRYNEMIEMGEEEDISFFNDLKEFVCNEDMNDSENYRIVATDMIDLDNYINYYATEIYIANEDWPTNNYALWRTKHKQNDRYADGRWRWMLFDVNLSMDPSVAKSDYVQRTINNDPMFASLMENDDFNNRFYDRLVEMANVFFAPDKIDTFIDEYEARMTEPMRNEYQRFYGDKSIDNFIDGCENIRRFFHLRHDYIIKKYGSTL